jgi:sec-independent protein translocase protein TatA
MFEGLVQPMHLLLVLVIALIVFGPGRLPELGKTLGLAIRDFRRAMNSGEEDRRGAVRPNGADAARPSESPGAPVDARHY